MKNVKVIILLICCIVGFNNEILLESTNDKTLILSMKEDNNGYKTSDCKNILTIDKNDLVYHDYGNALSLSKGSTCYIYDLSIDQKVDEDANIIIANILTGESKVIEKFYNQDYIEYTVAENGVFRLYLVSESLCIDLTDQVTVSYMCQNQSQGVSWCVD